MYEKCAYMPYLVVGSKARKSGLFRYDLDEAYYSFYVNLY